MLAPLLRRTLVVVAAVAVGAVGLADAGRAATAPGIALVTSLGHAAVGGRGDSISLTAPAGGVAAGDTVVLSAFVNSNNVHVARVADARGNSYSVDDEIHNTSTHHNVFVISGAVSTPLRAGDAITVTFDHDFYSIRLLTGAEFSGIAATDRVAYAAHSGAWIGADMYSVGWRGSSGPPAGAGDLLVGAFSVNTLATAFTAGSRFAALETVRGSMSGSAYSLFSESRVAAGGDESRADATKSPPTGQWTGQVVEYRAASSPFLPPQTLSVTKTGSGSGNVAGDRISCGSTCGETAAGGAAVTLTATADAGSVFTGWSGDCAGNGACTVTMDAARGVTATFARAVPLTVETSGDGAVKSADGAIACPGSCSETVAEGATVVLTATPADGSVFAGWGGDCRGAGDCTLTLDGPHHVTAAFVRAWPLDVEVGGSGSGSVSGGAGAIACGATCSATFADGTDVSLVAAAAPGSVFAGWGGDCSGVGDCTLTMDGPHHVSASFSGTVTLTVATTGGGGGTVTSADGAISCPGTCSAEVPRGGSTVLTATPDAESAFAGWSGDCSGTGTCTVAGDTPHGVGASFVPALGRPVDVGPGFVDATTRAPVRTPSGDVYVFAANDTASRTRTGGGVVHAYKSNRPGLPTAFAEVDAAHRPTSGGSVPTAIAGVDARLDANGVVHLVYVDDSFPTSLVYQTFSTLTDRWGAAEVIADHIGAEDRGRIKFALALDADGKPHVVYCVGTSVLYTNRVSGAWSAPTTVATGTAPLHPTLEFSPSGALDVAWLDDGPPPSIRFAFRSPGATAFTGPETVDDASILSNSNADQGPSLQITASRQPTVLYLAVVPGHPPGLSLPMSVVRVKTRTGSGWISTGPPGDVYTHTPQLYVRGDDRYVFLGHDLDVNFGYLAQVAGHGWSPETKLDTAPHDGSASIREAAPGDDVIDASYFDEDRLHDRSFLGEVYYVAVAPSDGSDAPPLDTTPPNVQLTAPAGGSTVSGTVSVTAGATDDTGVAGVQFTLDGQPLGTEQTTAPYGVQWDTTPAAGGVHVLGATARDAAGNTRDAAAIAVTVAAQTQPAPTPLPTGPPLAGHVEIGTAVDSNSAGTAEAYHATAAASGTVSSLAVYLDAASSASKVVVGLYADAGGHPGALLARAVIAAPVPGAWNQAPVAHAASVSSGDDYWLAVLGPAGAGTVRYADRCCGGGPAETSASTGLSDLPSSWTTGSSYADGELSAAAFGDASVALEATPAALSFSATTGGDDPAPQALATSGAGDAGCTVSTDASWLAATPASGDGACAPSVAVDIAGLGADTYHGTVTIAPAGAAGGVAATVAVTLTVTESAPATGTPTTVGEQTVGPAVDYDDAGLAEAYRTTAAAGVVDRFSVYLDAASAATTVAVGLYADSGGQPGALIASGTISSPVAGAWNDVAVTPVALDAGDYWIALLAPAGSGRVRFRDHCCGGGSPAETSASSSLAALPATWATGTVYDDGPFSAYAAG